MRTSEWLAPLVVGLFVATGAWLLPPPAPDPGPPEPADVAAPGWQPALWPHAATPPTAMTVLHVDVHPDTGRPYGVTLVEGTYAAGNFTIPRAQCSPVVVVESCGGPPAVLV